MTIRVTLFREELLREARRLSTEQRVEIAHEIAQDAISAAPVRTGEYRGGIGVEVSGDEVAVVDNDPESVYKEYGTSDTPAHAVLTDAARKHGKYSGMKPKGRS
jgi:hypothetical protein